MSINNIDKMLITAIKQNRNYIKQFGRSKNPTIQEGVQQSKELIKNQTKMLNERRDWNNK